MESVSEGCSKRKRKGKAFGFHSFVAKGCEVLFSGPFRDNVRLFLRECAEVEDYSVEGMPIWCSLLVDEKSGFAIPLYVVEETVERSSRPFCDHCRCVGWSHHYVSKRRYHIIIPADDDWDKPLSSNFFYLQNHLLHGLIHCNGYGHLVCVNGHEGGSKYACGSDFMDLWDRICTSLRTQQVTLEDRSIKHSMELRLLYAAAYGQSWFGRWGYKLCHGSFGVTASMYTNATQVLSFLHLETIMDDFKQKDHNRKIRHIVERYQKTSKNQLETLRDLLQFLLELKARLVWHGNYIIKTPKCSITATHQQMPNGSKQYRVFSRMAERLSSRWSASRLLSAAQVIVCALKEKQATSCDNVWMTRQEVRDTARLQIGDTGLLDFVLKSLDGCTVGNQVVIRGTNPSTRVREYTVKDLDGKPVVARSATNEREEIGQHLVYMYKHVLQNYPKGGQLSEIVRLTTCAILNCNHFRKEWPFQDDEDELLRYWVEMYCGEELWLTPLPPVMVVLPMHATVGELKLAGEQALRDTYCAFEEFQVWGIAGVDGNDNELVFGLFESGSCVRLRGSGLEKKCELRCEGGPESWRVDCMCGARDDDGERMVACDICEVWQHTKCEGIDDSDSVPQLFLCGRCGTELQQFSEWSVAGMV